MNRFAVRIGSALSIAFIVALTPLAVRAADISYDFNGRTITFTQVLDRPGGPAVSIDDTALSSMLDQLGATVDWQPGSPYILLTTAKPVIATFKLGETDYKFGDQTRHGTLAPFVAGIHAYLALADVLSVLSLPPLASNAEAVQSATPQPSPSSPGASPAPSPSGLSTPPPSPQAQPSPSPTAAAPALVTSVDARADDASYTVHIRVTGDTTYEWHRLRPPDNRWWLDFQNARLTTPAIEQPGAGSVASLRTHQDSPADVRIALSLKAFDEVQVRKTADGIDIVVSAKLASADADRMGSGAIGNAVVATQNVPVFHAANPRLIVIDPGHGGSDPGAISQGVQEKTVALDMALRLRDILIARGWQVAMTRMTDKDVYGPDATAKQELQARDDIANKAGARIFVSVHANGFMNAGPHGEETLYYKPTDLALAQAIDRSIAQEIGIKDDGLVHYKGYVINHADMPAVIVETAYLSNPDDFQLLDSAAGRQKMAKAIADGISAYLSDPR